MLIPDQPGTTYPHLLVQVGKEGTIDLVNRDNMGHLHSGSDSQIVQTIPYAIGGIWGSPAFWNNTVYFGGSYDRLKAFSFDSHQEKLSYGSESPESFNFPGSHPVHLVQRHQQWDRLDHPERHLWRRQRRIARLRCHQPGQRALQLRAESGPRSRRTGGEVHGPDHCGWTRLRRSGEPGCDVSGDRAVGGDGESGLSVTANRVKSTCHHSEPFPTRMFCGLGFAAQSRRDP